MQEESFLGRSVISTLSNGDTIRVLYKISQLEEVIYPNLIRTLQEGGFQAEGDLWDLLCTVAIGGTTSLNGPRYPNPKFFKTQTIKAEFMRSERDLAHALMTAVFCQEVATPYGRSPISFKEVNGFFKFDTDTGFRCATLMFHAENEPKEDLYQIVIEGTGNDLSKHRFTFDPSLTWLCRRYPNKSRVTASTGGALGSDLASNSDSDVPPQQVAVVSGKPAAGDGGGGGGGDGGGGGPRLSASRETLVRDLKSKSEFLSHSGDIYRCVVQKPTARPYKKDSKSFQKQRASARLAATARP